jgi:long-chain fatty acid transport protein
MKKSLAVVALILLCAPLTFATLVTNMNQSALYFRLLSRNASTDVDAVFYNPAGLTQLPDGFHFSLSNQTIFQTKTVINGFPLLNTDTYEGKVNVPIFPDVYAVYKSGKLAFSLGFGPNGGGGTADFAKGLPSFEWQFSALPSLVSLLGAYTTQYSVDINFKGSSVFYGVQANLSYELADWLSAAVGARLILAKNTYEGAISNVMINPIFILNPTGAMISAQQFFTVIGQPVLAAAVADKTVDAAQDGTGFTPILSLNFQPADGLNIGLKYEFKTALELTNKTVADDVGLFPDGVKTNNDIPAILSFGAEYALTPQFKATASFNYFFDKDANWDGREAYIDSNSWDLGLGAEYALSECIALSAGFLHTQFSLLDGYNSDFSHEMSNNSVGFGGRLKLMQNLDIDLGCLLTFYNASEKSITYTFFGIPLGSWPEEYKRTTFALALGINYHI